MDKPNREDQIKSALWIPGIDYSSATFVGPSFSRPTTFQFAIAIGCLTIGPHSI
jgi:hypothetical protein